MCNYVISTDSTADLPEDYINTHNLDIHHLYYVMGDTTYDGSNELSPKDFYDQMRSGFMPTTMASNPDNIKNSFEKHLKEGKDILHISFSSALSSSYNNAACVARDLSDKYLSRNIIVVDSLCASMGQGLLVHKAVMLKESGASLNDNVSWLEQNKLHLCHQFTVNDLNHLHRGGRVSKATAVLGTLINVKPVLHVNDEGRLTSLSNVRGRKKSLITLVDNMEKEIDGFDNDIVFISHGDCIDDADFVADLVKKRFNIQNILINFVSPTIGAHSGPGTVALFFMGNSR